MVVGVGGTMLCWTNHWRRWDRLPMSLFAIGLVYFLYRWASDGEDPW